MNPEINIQKVRLRTPRLLLRAWEPEDLEDFYEYASVDGTGQMAGWLPLQSLEESQKILSAFIKGGQCFAIVKDEKVIGSIEIKKYSEKIFPETEKLRGRELGFVLSHDYWNRGYMTEVVQEVLRYLFMEVGLDLVACSHFIWNHPSAKVQRKAGFHFYAKVKMMTRYGASEHGYMNVIYKKDWLEINKKSLTQALSAADQGKKEENS